MPEINRISIQISPEDKTVVTDAINTAKSKLDPIMISLQPRERQQLPKMNDGTFPFVDKTLDYALTNPNIVPPYVDVAELKVDFAAARELTEIYRPLLQLVENLNDTIMLAGSEAYVASLAIYNSVKVAAKLNIPGTKAIYDDLKKRFEQQPEKTETVA